MESRSFFFVSRLTSSFSGGKVRGTLHSALATSADEIFIWGGIHSAMPFQTLQAETWIVMIVMRAIDTN